MIHGTVWRDFRGPDGSRRCYCETERWTVAILNSNVCTLLIYIYLIKLIIGDSDFSFLIETIVFSFEFKFK